MNGRKARQFGHLRSVVHAEPSRAGWVSMCKVLSKWDSQETLEVLDYLEQSIAHWPDELRQPTRGLRPSHPAFRLVRDVCDAKIMMEMLEYPQNVRVSKYRFNDYSYPDALWGPLASSGLLDMATCIESESSFTHKARLVTMLCSAPMLALKRLKFRGFFYNQSPWERFFQASWMRHMESLIVRDASVAPKSLDVLKTLSEVLSLKRFEMYGWNHFDPSALKDVLNCDVLQNIEHLAINTILERQHDEVMSGAERQWTVLDVASVTADFANSMLSNPQYANLHTLKLNRPEAEVSSSMALIGQMDSLRHLDITHASLGDRAVRVPWRSPLRSLRLNACGMTRAVTSHLLAGPWIQEVDDLTLIDCHGIAPNALIEALAERETPLRHLRLVNITMKSEQLEALLTLPALSELASLYLKQEHLQESFYEMLIHDSVVPRDCRVRIKTLLQSKASHRMVQKHFNGR